MSTNITRKGLAAARYLRSLANAEGDPTAAMAYAEGQDWRSTPSVIRALKAAVDGLDASSAAALIRPVAIDFAEYLRPLTLVWRVPGVLHVPFNTRMVGMTAGGSASWVGEGAPKPLTAAILAEQATSLGPAKVVAISIATQELLRLSTPSAEETLLADLGRACAEAVDLAFIDPANAGTVDKPASVTYGAPSFASTGATLGAIDGDLGGLIGSLSDMGSDLSAAAWIMRPTTAAYLARLRGTGGGLAFPTVTARGGTLFGLPVVTSGNVPLVGSPAATCIVLLDADGIALADEGDATFDVARHAAAQMSDAPYAGAQQLVSLWQLNMVALRAERTVNWRRRRTGTAAVLTGVGY